MGQALSRHPPSDSLVQEIDDTRHCADTNLSRSLHPLPFVATAGLEVVNSEILLIEHCHVTRLPTALQERNENLPMNNAMTVMGPSSASVEQQRPRQLSASLFQRSPALQVTHSSAPSHALMITFRVTMDCELLKIVWTQDADLYERLVVGRKNPLTRTSDLESGCMQELRHVYRAQQTPYFHSFEMSLPESLGKREVLGFFTDDENIVLAKARGIVVTEEELILSEELETRPSLERASRKLGLLKSQWKAAIPANTKSPSLDPLIQLHETVHASSLTPKRRVQFIESEDGMKLAYRYYGQETLHCKIMVVLIALNSHLVEVLAHRLSSEATAVHVLLGEVRGFGHSGGERGRARHWHDLMRDIRCFVRHVRANHEQVRLVLAGHGHVVGMILNYVLYWKDATPVDGCIFITPEEFPLQPFWKGWFSRSMFQISCSEQEHEIHPLLVDVYSRSVVKACSIPDWKQAFMRLKGEWRIFLSGVDQNKYENLFPKERVEHIADQTGVGMLRVVASFIYPWLMNLKCDNLGREEKVEICGSETSLLTHDTNSVENFEKSIVHQEDLTLIQKCFFQFELQKQRISYLLDSSNHRIAYCSFVPEHKPVAVLIILEDLPLKRLLGFILHKKYSDLAVFCLDLSRKDINQEEKGKIKIAVRYCKCNYPDVPILLGGHGQGALMAINYGSWTLREPVHGYLLFVSPMSESVHELLKQVTVPFAAWTDAFSSFSSLLQPLPHSSHWSALITMTAYAIPWIKQFVKMMAPKLLFRLTLPRLEDFQVLQMIGRGSFGRVFLVRHKASQHYFAMKVLIKNDVLAANEARHACSERNILRDLNSPFVVAYVASFQDARHLYLVMEFAVGGELFTQLSLRKRFPNEMARFYAAEMVLFFEAMHLKNVVYRDAKPENILLDALGHIKVADMGFAKVLTRGRTASFCGTPTYIAPEMIVVAERRRQSEMAATPREENSYGFSVDLWSLGCLIYEMLIGQTPFHDSTPRAVYRRILHGHLEFPWHITVDPLAKDLIRKLLQRDPSHRLSLAEVKRHKWFKSIDWQAMKRREVSAPFVPKICHAGDTSHFLVLPGAMHEFLEATTAVMPGANELQSMHEHQQDDVFKDF